MGAKQIDSQTTITRPGTYTLTGDIQNGGGTRLSEAYIRIEANDVVLDGNGVTVGGGGVSDTSGIVASNARNVTIEDLTIERWGYGIRFENVVGGQIRDVRVTSNGYGLLFEDADLVVLRDSLVSKNLLGLVLDPASNVFPWNNTVEHNSGRDVYTAW